MKELYQSLFQRKRPEDIANIILRKYGKQYTLIDRSILEKAAKNALSRNHYGYSSMNDEFFMPVGIHSKLKVINDLFPNSTIQDDFDSANPEHIKQYLLHIETQIKKNFGENDFIKDRLNRVTRKEQGLELSNRQYNKRFRLIKRLEAKREKLIRELKKREYTLIGKSGLAIKISWEDFSKDVYTACFIAYYTARCKLRSEFTISSQERPYDEIAHMLFSKCKQSNSTNWWMISHVFSHPEVMEKISEEQKGQLIGMWYCILEDISLILKEVWDKSNINRTSMIVRKGNDSSTWNLMANAWNKARDYWIALHYSLGTQNIVEEVCFGKVLRLMAADVVYWHQSEGSNLDLDTLIWNMLPLPWEVFTGQVICNSEEVKRICKQVGIDPYKRGWIAPKPKTLVTKYKPTPELVHGISIGHPGLAIKLKKLGYFSGK